MQSTVILITCQSQSMAPKRPAPKGPKLMHGYTILVGLEAVRWVNCGCPPHRHPSFTRCHIRRSAHPPFTIVLPDLGNRSHCLTLPPPLHLTGITWAHFKHTEHNCNKQLVIATSQTKIIGLKHIPTNWKFVTQIIICLHFMTAVSRDRTRSKHNVTHTFLTH